MENTEHRAEVFEIGPIRPPSEADSLLIRVTKNCPWNKCKFCKIYKKTRFHTRPMEEIERDIDAIANMRDILYEQVFVGSELNYERFRALIRSKPPEVRDCYSHVLGWIIRGARTVFLQDANTMVLSFDKLMHILSYLRGRLPEIERVTTYGRADSLNRLSAAQYVELEAAGLNRIHSGFETGSDNVLRLINKGYTKGDEIESGQKIKAAGIELSVYVMPGVGGKALSEENAIETADVISRVNPSFVRVRTFVCLPGSGMMEELQNGNFTECTDMEKLSELKLMLLRISGADGEIFSDHTINLLEGIRGNLASDKQRMLELIEAIERLPELERKRFQLARRMGLLRDASELSELSGYHLDFIENAIREYPDEENWEALLLSLLKRYV